ncbi:hypothetical protein OROGR_003213 [Orobanche gracilis]
MAKNREPEKPVESDTESGEEDDDESSEEAGSQDSDSEPSQTRITKKPSSSAPATAKKPQPPSASKSQQREPSSSSDEEESESDSESDSDGPSPKVRPIAIKPMDDPQKSNKGAKRPRPKPAASDLDTPNKPATGKRPAEENETDVKDAKKSKKKPAPESSGRKVNDDSKKFLFQRLWSEDDEIAILKGMIDYKAKKKSDPVTDLNAFHDFIKKNLHVDVTRTQLQDKIRKLKKKFENNKSKEKEGKERIFFKSHEQKAYELSKYVWGTDNWKENAGEKVGASPKSNGSTPRNSQTRRATGAGNEDGSNEKSVVVVNDDSERMFPAKRMKRNGASVEEIIMMFGNEMFEEGKGHEKEKEWKKLRMDEIEAYMRNLEVKAAQARLVVDNLKSAGH